MDLFWSKRGVVACVAHAPLPDSEAWRLDCWQLVPAWRPNHGAPLQCQFCHGRPYVHRFKETRDETPDEPRTMP